METLEDRVAVVTGAASGIGRALAELFVERGSSVVLADVEAGPLAAAVAELEAGGATVLGVPTDVADGASVQALADAAVERFGAVHVLCNNAGVSGLVGRSWATPLQDWEWVLGVNVMGVVHGIRSFLPILLQQTKAHVVNTGSAACFETVPGMAPYGASKHAVLGISEALRLELLAAGANVGVTVLVPGDVVNTPIMASDRNWPERLGARQEPDADPVATVVRMGFAAAMAGGVEPRRCASAAIEAILGGQFLVCDDPEQLAGWGRHPGHLAAGQQPVWPPAPA
ncbi:MAG TPA: SDR family NAD(P)-dependent oxidoreductase [Acidimicrobiales bacterium]